MGCALSNNHPGNVVLVLPGHSVDCVVQLARADVGAERPGCARLTEPSASLHERKDGPKFDQRALQSAAKLRPSEHCAGQ